MNAIVFDPEGMRVPIPFARRPSSLANDVAHCVAVGPLLSCLYSNDSPVDGSRTALIVNVGCSSIARMSEAMEYREEMVGLPVDRA